MALSKRLSFVMLEGALELIDSADKIKKSYISLIRLILEKKGLVYDHLSWAKGCLFDPDKGYISLARQLVGLSTLVTDALKLEPQIPKEMVPKIKRLEESVRKANQAIQNMRNRIEPLLEVWSNITMKITTLLVTVYRKRMNQVQISAITNNVKYLAVSDWLQTPGLFFTNQLILSILGRWEMRLRGNEFDWGYIRQETR